jgi:hypothetical protein
VCAWLFEQIRLFVLLYVALKGNIALVDTGVSANHYYSTFKMGLSLLNSKQSSFYVLIGGFKKAPDCIEVDFS